MYKGPPAQYADYPDEGTERADDRQLVKCFYSLQAWADPASPPSTHDPPRAKGQLSWSQGAFPAWEVLPRQPQPIEEM